MSTTDAGPAPAPSEDAALKSRHRAMWALGDYPDLATRLVADLGPTLVRACAPEPGEEVLDVAAGTGNAAIPAAAAGARVTASDLTPELLEAGRARAAAQGVDLAWEVADAEALPFADASFDVVLSCIGVMFAPHHQQAADELVRVCRPGGRIGLLSWTPAGVVGQLFAAMKPFLPPPPPGAQPPPLWGDEAHVRVLLGDRVEDARTRTETMRVDLFPGPTDMRDYFAAVYGPTLVAYRGVADDAGRRAELDAAIDDVAARFREPDGSMAWEYLLLTARRR